MPDGRCDEIRSDTDLYEMRQNQYGIANKHQSGAALHFSIAHLVVWIKSSKSRGIYNKVSNGLCFPSYFGRQCGLELIGKVDIF